MKKLMGIVAIALISASSVFAQTPATTAKQTPKKVAAKTTVATKPVAAKATVTTPAAGVKLKADGTPDKRYKASAKAVTGPTKKDGTADMRYKANKAAAKKN